MFISFVIEISLIWNNTTFFSKNVHISHFMKASQPLWIWYVGGGGVILTMVQSKRNGGTKTLDVNSLNNTVLSPCSSITQEKSLLYHHRFNTQLYAMASENSIFNSSHLSRLQVVIPNASWPFLVVYLAIIQTELNILYDLFLFH